jgi:octaprenyl-diphosphate synthase
MDAIRGGEKRRRWFDRKSRRHHLREVNLFPKATPDSLEHLVQALPRLSTSLDIKKHFKPIHANLAAIEERIKKQASDFDPGISGYIEYACESQGKRIRPALAILSGHATGKVHNGHLDLAVVVELIHLATLVHDDIMDGASQRRGQPTAYAKWGAELSVLLGDCLFSHALMLCTGFPTTEVSRKIAEAANEVCSGEILQTQRRFDLKLNLPEYIRIIEMKTGALFRVATELAAYLNDAAPEVTAGMRDYGAHLGIAYQIYDDCLDLVGTEGMAGKTLGTDLQKGKLTLPLLYVYHGAKPEEQLQLREVILHGSELDRLALLRFVVERGGLRQAVAKVKDYLARARKSLEILPATEYRDVLHALPEALSRHVETLA